LGPRMSSVDARRQLEHVGGLPRVAVDVELRVEAKLPCSGINRAPDSNRHGARVAVCTQLTGVLEAGERMREGADCFVDVVAVEAMLPDRGDAVARSRRPRLVVGMLADKLLIGKALAVVIATLAIAYTIFGIFVGFAALFAHPGIESAILAGSHVTVRLVSTPLVAGWSIWVGIAISDRSSDVRVVQQLSVFANLPSLAFVALMTLT
jgi:hypothetical protein